MEVHEEYMHRCLQIAAYAKGRVSPNPMVGAVLVYNGKIIGEGYHQEYGKHHAEVNAINSVKDKSLLSKATLYVSLEPCSHYGKTPPCAELIIKSHISKVIVATLDPFPKVSGRGVKILQDAGIDVKIGVLEKEAKLLNKEFITYNIKKRPYIYLKWAQSKNGYIDEERDNNIQKKPVIISNQFTQILVHKLRTEVDGIMVGTNTAIKDNPSLSARLWYGKNPERITFDSKGRIPKTYNLFTDSNKSIIFTEKVKEITIINNVTYVPIVFNDDMYRSVLDYLFKNQIQSIMIEGGTKLLQSFINKNLWDEAYIETSNVEINKGIKAPSVQGNVLVNRCVFGSFCSVVQNVDNYKIL